MENNKIISLCMIVKDEELTLARCLNSVKGFVDEIIIVDTGSIDNTKKIAQKFTDKIFDFTWVNDFSAARNFAFSKATAKYIMWLDADDVVPVKTQKEILKIKNYMNADTYMMKYIIPISKKNNFSFYRERIVKNCEKARWHGAVHECIVPFGKIDYINGSVIHKKEKQSNPERNLRIYNFTLKSRELTPREMYYYGRELYDNKKYTKAIKVLKDFSKKPTCIDNLIEAYLIIANCYEIMKNTEQQKKYLFKILELSVPNAQVCCKVGDYFLQNKQFNEANYWYMQAIKSKKNEKSIFFVNDIYYNYYPYLQLCVSYFNLNEISKAKFYNEEASKFIESEAVKYNRKYLNDIKQEQ